MIRKYNYMALGPLNIYRDMRLDAAVIAKLTAGNKFELVEVPEEAEGDWRKVYLAPDVAGYISPDADISPVNDSDVLLKPFNFFSYTPIQLFLYLSLFLVGIWFIGPLLTLLMSLFESHDKIVIFIAQDWKYFLLLFGVFLLLSLLRPVHPVFDSEKLRFWVYFGVFILIVANQLSSFVVFDKEVVFVNQFVQHRNYHYQDIQYSYLDGAGKYGPAYMELAFYNKTKFRLYDAGDRDLKRYRFIEQKILAVTDGVR